MGIAAIAERFTPTGFARFQDASGRKEKFSHVKINKTTPEATGRRDR